MTDADLLALIRNTPALKALADQGRDADLADAIPSYATLTLPRPFTAADIMGGVSAANRAKVAVSGIYFGIQTSVQAQDRPALAAEAQLAVDAGLITQAEQSAINTILTATETVPDTSVSHEQVSRILGALRPVVDGAIRGLPIDWSKA